MENVLQLEIVYVTINGGEKIVQNVRISFFSNLPNIAWCPSSCSGRGTCIGINNCSCIEQWYGPECNTCKYYQKWKNIYQI